MLVSLAPRAPRGSFLWGGVWTGPESDGREVISLRGAQGFLPPDRLAREVTLNVRGTACSSLVSKIWWHLPPHTILLGTGGRRFLLLRIRSETTAGPPLRVGVHVLIVPGQGSKKAMLVPSM